MRQPAINNSSSSWPVREEADRLLREGALMNPGPWVEHARNAGRAASLIGAACGMDPEKAYALGTLHDIGRLEGRTYLHHIIAGYRFMLDRGYPLVARICLTHSFPLPFLDCYYGKNDCSPEETAFLRDYLRDIQFDDYDRLIQLCDSLADPGGFCLVEKRLIDVICRYGTDARTGEKVRAQMANRDYFQEKTGGRLYDLLPGVVENSFS